MTEYGFYSQKLCGRLLNEFTGERCSLFDGHDGPCQSGNVERRAGIEPASLAWKAEALTRVTSAAIGRV